MKQSVVTHCSIRLLLVLLVLTILLIRLATYYLYDSFSFQTIQAVEVEPISYFAMCLIVKNDYDLLEWVDYHHHLGASKFYIFDHNSTIPIKQILQEHIGSGLVDYEHYNSSFTKKPQSYVYDRCIKEHKAKHRFISFIDSDEYIVVVNKTQKIPDVLRRYENYGGLTLNWKMFGSSGHVTRPTGGVRLNYRMCFDNFHVKTIGNTKFLVRSGQDAHHLTYKPKYFAVDTNYTRVNGAFNPGVGLPVSPDLYGVMYINHYVLRSREDFDLKKVKGRASSNLTPSVNESQFEIVNRLSTVDCGTLEYH